MCVLFIYLNFIAHKISIFQYNYDKYFIYFSNLQSLTTPILFWWLWDLCKMLADASKLSFLKVQGPGQIGNNSLLLVILLVNCNNSFGFHL